MAPRDRRALWPRPRSGAQVPFAHLFSVPFATPLRRQSLFPTTRVSRAAHRARRDRRLMSEIDLGIGTLAWPALIRHPRKKKR
jgi:hypothetical protein